MSAKNNKKLILSGVLLIVSIVCYLLLRIPFFAHGNYWWRIYDTDYGSSSCIDTILFAFSIIATIVLIAYCFKFSKTKLSSVVYYISLGIFALLSTYSCIIVSYNVLNDLPAPFFLAITVIMLIVKAKSNKCVSIVGTVIFGAYAVIELIFDMTLMIIYGYEISVYDLLFYTYLITRFIAFFNIWLAEGGSISFNKKTNTVVKTPLEDNLVSLKQLYDSGAITEQEYNYKKNQILNKL